MYQLKLQSHLLHSDESTYFYKYNSKVRSLLYSNKISTIPLVLSAFGLLLVLGMMISPSTSTGERVLGGDKAYAEEGASNEPVPYTVPPDDGVSLTINTPLPDDEVIEKQVSGSGAKYITVDFTVGAHNVDDYKVYVQADSATLTGKSYSDTITTINAPTTATEMNSATKKWGYAVAEGQNVSADGMTFNTIQTGVSTPAASVTGENGAKILNHTQPYTLAFAANLDGAKADHYKSNITLSVAANAEEVTNIGFAGATYMQDVDKTFCDKDTIPIGTEGRLIDKRDGKVYWVAKLRDGLCWMTQNLDLDLTEGESLTSVLSDVESWTPEEDETTLASSQLTTTSWPDANNIVRSYDPGVAIFVNGIDRKEVISSLAFGEEWLTRQEAGILETWTATYDAAFVAATNYSSTDGKMICTKKANDMLGDMTSTYLPCRIYYYEYARFDKFYGVTKDATHYLQGNYYSWGAATAKTGSSATSTSGKDYPINASNSICPKGWKLPSGVAVQNSPGNFQTLTNAYGITTGINTGRTDTDLRATPLFFVRSGDVYAGRSMDYGLYGFYWSSSANDTSHAFALHMSNGLVAPSHNSIGVLSYDYNRRSSGFPVRCVAR